MSVLDGLARGSLLSGLAVMMTRCGGESASCPRDRDAMQQSPDAGTTQAPDSGTTHCCVGTPESAVMCVPCPDDHFDVRIASSEVRADGAPPVAVLAIGTSVDGAPSVATVALRLSREDAGTLADVRLELGPLGTGTDFIPCLASDRGCLGPFSISLTYPNEPLRILASRAGNLVEPDDGGS